MTTPLVLIERYGPVAELTLNRPDRLNAMNGALIDALIRAVRQLGSDEDVRAIVLTGAGRAFSAGCDLSDLSRLQDAGTALDWQGGEGLATVMRTCPVPVIAAVNGLAVQGGLALAMLCDFMIASDTATFAELSARLGISPGWGLSQMLPRLIGLNRARQMSLTGEYIDADTARDWGLVNEVLPPHLLMARARELAGRIAEADPATTTRVRDLINESADHGLTASLRREGQVFGSHLNVGTLQQAARHRHQMLGRNRELNGTGSAS
ncbi:enoyl-CoA hydratase [Albibacillus kandeliae]|uniref:enoyl-CoA hydratase n=1 Tax=Albibacillus kandeliae TaxID=2174228 RepID=UPI000D68BBBE|nr:enoyl-CoA hydratase [Albibacillus kandeliae]